MKLKQILTAAAAAALLFALTACGNGDAEGAAAPPAAAASGGVQAPAGTSAGPDSPTAAKAASASGKTGSADTAASAADDPAVNMTLGSFCVEGEPGQKASLLFAEKAAEYSGGSVTVEVQNASRLGNAAAMAEQTALGRIEACLVCESTLDPYDPRYALLPLPFGYTGYQQAYAVEDGPFREWVGDGTLEQKGLHVVNAWDYGFRNLTNSQHPVEHPEDVKGLKIRTGQEIQLGACMEALGADVRQIVFSELISALKQKTVDGQENPLSTICSNALWECRQKYLTMTRHQWQALNLVVNDDWWKGLTDAQRGAIEKAAFDAQKSMREEVSGSEEGYLERLEEEGVEIIRDIDIDEFREAMAPAYEQLGEHVKDPGLVEKMKEIIRSVEP